MKPVNEYGQRVLQVLTEGLNNAGDDRKFGNGRPYMAVSVERIDVPQVYSVAHYYKQNGDLMADPEMVFVVNDAGIFLPVYFKQAGLGLEQSSAEYTTIDGKLRIERFRPKLQADHAIFAGTWLRNIAEQQDLRTAVAAKKK